MDYKDLVTLAIPSDGALFQPTQDFLKSCGLSVYRNNLRRYTAEIPTLPGIRVLFQRSADITAKVEDGSADMGIVGLDRYLELSREGGTTNIVMDNLGFGQCQLVIGLPDSWVDVTSLADLADVSMEFRQGGGELKIVTKYPRLVERYLLRNGINFFSMVQSSGTLEAAPAMGFADIIVDVSESGTTMRENRLKTIDGGSILSSSACLIGNYESFGTNSIKLDSAKKLVDMVEAYLRSQNFYSVTANIRGETPADIAKYVLDIPEITGLTGPTVSKVYSSDGESWFAVTVIVEKSILLDAVARIRNVGGSSVTVSRPNYVFQSDCEAHKRLTA